MASVIKTIWDRTLEAVEEHKRSRRYKSLKLQGEISVRTKSVEVENAKDYLEKVITEERDRINGEPNYDKIYEANEKLKIAEERLKLSSEMFKELFGVEPSYINE